MKKPRRRIRPIVNDIHAALYPERYDHPRLWDRVPWPQRHVAFELWYDRTLLVRLTGGPKKDP